MKVKIFVRSRDLAGGAPEVIAVYDANSEVTADAHGPEAVMLVVPRNVIRNQPKQISALPSAEMPKLADDWRARAAETVATTEANRRIEEVFPPTEQLESLHELLNFIGRHGADFASWPQEAKTRKAELDTLWNYVNAVRERARATKTLSANPTSDKVWPTRITRAKR